MCVCVCLCSVCRFVYVACNGHATGLMLVVGFTFFSLHLFYFFPQMGTWGEQCSAAEKKSQWILTWIICAQHIYSWEHVHVVRFNCNFDHSPVKLCGRYYIGFRHFVSHTHTHTKFLRSNFFIWPSFICQTTSVIGRQIYISDWYRSYNKSDCWTLEVNLSGHPAHVGSIHIDGQTCVQYSCHMLHSIRAT